MNTAQVLVKELREEVGLDEVDAYRSAFTALACSQGWTKARVGRYLGISRARVGQKVDKLLHYATTLQTTPQLTDTMVRAANTQPVKTQWDDIVQYGVKDWSDIEFASQLLGALDSPLVVNDKAP